MPMTRPKPRHFGQAPRGELKEKRAGVGARRVKPVRGLVQVVVKERDFSGWMMEACPFPRRKAASRASRRRDWLFRGGFETILDDGEGGGDLFRGSFVGAVGFAFDEDAEVALGVEEGEKFLRIGIGGNGDGEGD